MTLRIGSLFSGYGGLDLAVSAYFGAEVAWYSEINPAACRVLEAHHPDLQNIGDVTTLSWDTVEPVDIITGGYPCQPFSLAGQRKGTKDERHLWPYVREAISVLRPRYVVLENVRGHLSLGLDAVLADLASLGMSAEWGVVRASDAGAPHRRERVFIVARDPDRVARSSGRSFVGGRGEVAQPETEQRTQRSDGGPVPDAEGGRWREGTRSAEETTGHVIAGTCDDCGSSTADSDGSGSEARIDAGCDRERLREEPLGCAASVANSDGGTYRPERWGGRVDQAIEESDVSGEVGGDPTAGSGSQGTSDEVRTWGPYEKAVLRWEPIIGRRAPDPTVPGRDDRPRLSPYFVEWMMGLPEGWVTGHGLSPSQELKMLGNGVVPQQAFIALDLLRVDCAVATCPRDPAPRRSPS